MTSTDATAPGADRAPHTTEGVLTALTGLIRHLASATTVVEVLTALVDTVVDATEATGAAVLERHATTGRVEVAVDTGLDLPADQAALATLWATSDRDRPQAWTDAAGGGAVIAIDPRTSQQRWRLPMSDVTSSGILTSASNLLFTGNREGHFHILDAESGDLLWRKALGGMIANGPMSYMVDGKQYVAVAAGHSLFVLALEN